MLLLLLLLSLLLEELLVEETVEALVLLEIMWVLLELLVEAFRARFRALCDELDKFIKADGPVWWWWWWIWWTWLLLLEEDIRVCFLLVIKFSGDITGNIKCGELFAEFDEEIEDAEVEDKGEPLFSGFEVEINWGRGWLELSRKVAAVAAAAAAAATAATLVWWWFNGK